MTENWPPPPSPEVPTMNYALWVDRVLAALADGGIALLVMFILYVLLFVLGGVLRERRGEFHVVSPPVKSRRSSLKQNGEQMLSARRRKPARPQPWSG